VAESDKKIKKLKIKFLDLKNKSKFSKMSALRFAHASRTNKSLVFVDKQDDGYFFGGKCDEYIIPFAQIVFAQNMKLTAAETEQITKTAESKAELEVIRANVDKILALVPLAETATEDEKTAREAIVKKSRDEVTTQYTKIVANKHFSKEAAIYEVRALALVNKMNNVTPAVETKLVDVTSFDMPVTNRVKVVMTNKHSFVLEFVNAKDYENFTDRV